MPRVNGRPMPAVGARIKAWRQQRGLTRREVAEALGVSESYIQHVEQGQNSLRVDKLLELAAVLQVPVPHLLPDESGPPAPPESPPAPGTEGPPAAASLMQELQLPEHATALELAVALARYMAAREATELERIRQEHATARERIRYVDARRADAEYLAQANLSWALGHDPQRLPHRSGHEDAGVAVPG